MSHKRNTKTALRHTSARGRQTVARMNYIAAEPAKPSVAVMQG